MTPRWKLEAFEWLPVEKWTPNNLLSHYQVDGKRYCKVCDKWVEAADEKSHCSAHRKEKREMIRKARAEAVARRKEALKLARAARKENRKHDEQHK